jgi:type I restriction-modification system DNA methylase subunit
MDWTLVILNGGIPSITPKLLEGDKVMKFDVVVANPPFSLDKWAMRTPRLILSRDFFVTYNTF